MLLGISLSKRSDSGWLRQLMNPPWPKQFERKELNQWQDKITDRRAACEPLFSLPRSPIIGSEPPAGTSSEHH